MGFLRRHGAARTSKRVALSQWRIGKIKMNASRISLSAWPVHTHEWRQSILSCRSSSALHFVRSVATLHVPSSYFAVDSSLSEGKDTRKERGHILFGDAWLCLSR